jgi:hypothetical protein
MHWSGLVENMIYKLRSVRLIRTVSHYFHLGCQRLSINSFRSLVTCKTFFVLTPLIRSKQAVANNLFKLGMKKSQLTSESGSKLLIRSPQAKTEDLLANQISDSHIQPYCFISCNNVFLMKTWTTTAF